MVSIPITLLFVITSLVITFMLSSTSFDVTLVICYHVVGSTASITSLSILRVADQSLCFGRIIYGGWFSLREGSLLYVGH